MTRRTATSYPISATCADWRPPIYPTDYAGAVHHSAKLTSAQVAEIRASSEPLPVLAKRYGVSRVAVWKVRHRRSFRNEP